MSESVLFSVDNLCRSQLTASGVRFECADEKGAHVSTHTGNPLLWHGRTWSGVPLGAPA